MFSSKMFYDRRIVLLAFLLSAAIGISGCSSETPEAGAPSQVKPADNPAAALLTEAQAATRTMKKYGFQLQMTQKVTGATEADNAYFKVDMVGRVERDPLKLDQTIKNDDNGEVSTLRSLIVPGAYYMYMQDFEEWSKLSKTDAEDNIKTLSDFQVNPEKALKDIQSLGNSLKDEKTGQAVTVKYDGAGPEGKAYLEGVLESAMGLSSFDKSVRDTLDIQQLNVSVTLDAVKHWPLSYRIESTMTLEFEPGKKSSIHQTIAGTYSKHNASAAVTVPKEAKEAIDPDQMPEEDGSGPL
ncbi:hypothetical protein SD71_06325 [Cohnella kolymensis]|uniref:Lipoprotein n=1 Tax=Cohnella kolymensis TaxID=1590652 RepID=A0ABR5A6H7_9BACL|nr:DUF6612 family protein [Cohnella kolymensis]KIL36628.1 hypothetical protein SD71_06325 [Cohnella kolymensis]